MENNKIELIGVVDGEYEFSHSAFGVDFYILMLKVRRTSGIDDIIKLLVNSAMFDIEENMNGRILSIAGEIRTKNIIDQGIKHLNIYVYILEMVEIQSEIKELIGSNIAYIEGSICVKQPIRTTPSGRVITDIVIACNRRYGKTSYLPIVTWGYNAKLVNNMNIGTSVKIWGRLQSRDYYKDNEVHTVQELSAQTIEIIDIDNLVS